MGKSNPAKRTTDRAGALRLARRLGCEGAHQLADGSWAPCPTPEALTTVVREGADGYKKWKRAQSTMKNGDRERGITGIDSLPDGGLVSGKSALGRAIDEYRTSLIDEKALGPTIGGGGAVSDQDGVDHDGDGVIFDGTPNERPAPKKRGADAAASKRDKRKSDARRSYLASQDTDKGPKATQANQRETRLDRAVARERLHGWEPSADGRRLKPAAGRRGPIGPAGPRNRGGAVNFEANTSGVASPDSRASSAENTNWAPGAADAPVRRRGRKSAEDMMMHTGHEESSHLLNLRQISLVRGFKMTVHEYGEFDQGTGPDGAHYVAKSPFASEGMVCANCALYEGPRACHIVEGDIAPEAICKFWVIPEDLIVSKGEDSQS